MNVITLVDGDHVIGAISINAALPDADLASIKEVLTRALVRMGHAVAAPLIDEQERDHTGWGFFVEHDEIAQDRRSSFILNDPGTTVSCAEQLFRDKFPMGRRVQPDSAKVSATSHSNRTRPIYGGVPAPDYKTPLVDPVGEEHLKRVLV